MAIQIPPTAYSEQLSEDLTHRGMVVYEDFLKETLERDHLGEVVAIEPDSLEYAIGSDSFTAVLAIRMRSIKGRVFVRRIGPPTDEDKRFAARIAKAEAKGGIRYGVAQPCNLERRR